MGESGLLSLRVKAVLTEGSAILQELLSTIKETVARILTDVPPLHGVLICLCH